MSVGLGGPASTEGRKGEKKVTHYNAGRTVCDVFIQEAARIYSLERGSLAQ